MANHHVTSGQVCPKPLYHHSIYDIMLITTSSYGINSFSQRMCYVNCGTSPPPSYPESGPGAGSVATVAKERSSTKPDPYSIIYRQ